MIIRKEGGGGDRGKGDGGQNNWDDTLSSTHEREKLWKPEGVCWDNDVRRSVRRPSNIDETKINVLTFPSCSLTLQTPWPCQNFFFLQTTFKSARKHSRQRPLMTNINRKIEGDSYVSKSGACWDCQMILIVRVRFRWRIPVRRYFWIFEKPAGEFIRKRMIYRSCWKYAKYFGYICIRGSNSTTILKEKLYIKYMSVW